MMVYRGYIGKFDADADAGILHGDVLDTRDVITFQGQSVVELKTDFEGSVDDYLAFCKQRGKQPDTPFQIRSSRPE